MKFVSTLTKCFQYFTKNPHLVDVVQIFKRPDATSQMVDAAGEQFWL